jgi:hypothetical protein
MPPFLFQDRHEPADCGAVFASFRGFDSPLRSRRGWPHARTAGNTIWWSVDAATAAEALALLPYYVGERPV